MKLIIDNENKKISRNIKRRLEQNFKKSDEMKSVLNKIKTEQKKKNFLIKYRN